MVTAKDELEFSADHDLEALSRLQKIGFEELQEKVHNLPFVGMACEICRDVPSTHTFSDDVEGKNEFQRRYGAYVLKQAIELTVEGMQFTNRAECFRFADEIVRDKYGFRSDAETGIDDEKLFKIVKELYPREEVLHHHKPEWLDDDNLEVFIPHLNLAIEYLGIEHYEVIENNGGRSSLRDVVAQDILKNEKCLDEGIYLLVFPYFKEIDSETVAKKISLLLERNEDNLIEED